MKQKSKVLNHTLAIEIKEKQVEDRRRIAKALGLNKELTSADVRRLLTRYEQLANRGLIS